MTTQERIDQAADKFAQENYYSGPMDWENARIDWAHDVFKAGAEWALQQPELQKEYITGFFDWYQKEGYKIDKDAMMGMPTDELFTLYLEYLNKQA